MSLLSRGRKKNNELSIWYTNADNLLNKRKELELRLSLMKNKPHVIAITEIKPKNLSTKLLQSEFKLDGYELFISDDLDKKSERGVLIYTQSNLIVSTIQVPVDFCEGLFITIRLLNSKRFIIGTIYRSPSSSIYNDIKLNETITYINDKFKDPILLMGDFNYGSIDWKFIQVPDDITHKREIMFLRNLRNNFLQQHVMEPTRQRGSDTPHILDLVITNDQFISDITYLSPLGRSDHSVLTFSCSLELDLELARNDDKWIFHKGNYNDLRCYLRRHWDIEFQGVDNANDLWITFKTIIMEGMDKYIPPKTSWYFHVAFKQGEKKKQ
jgi:hypothetical protein